MLLEEEWSLIEKLPVAEAAGGVAKGSMSVVLVVASVGAGGGQWGGR